LLVWHRARKIIVCAGKLIDHDAHYPSRLHVAGYGLGGDIPLRGTRP
jgi:hypothetical protein